MPSLEYKPVWSRHLWPLITALAAVSLLLVARAVSTSTSRNSQFATDEEAGQDQQDAGASRGWGGNNKTEHIKDFPWIAVLFRNPNARDRSPLDGYQTGYALELQHNHFLIRNTGQVHASRGAYGQGDVLMGMVKATDLVVLDPKVSRWPQDGAPGQGNITMVLSIGWDYGIYELANFKSELNEPIYDDGTGYYFNGFDRRRYLPGGQGRPADGSRVLRYPLWNDDVNLASNCYLYKFSPPDYSDIARAAVDEYGLPPSLYDGNVTKFPVDELRYFTRSPVKLVKPCDKYKRCGFVFDDERYREEHVQGKYSARRARVCGQWQDVGAPIMCGVKPPLHKGFSPQGVYYERMYMRLSYVVLDTKTANTTSGCTDNFLVQRLADYESEVRPVLDKLRRALFDKHEGRARNTPTRV